MPLHPLDTLANKLSRLDILRRSIKFIEAMSFALECSEEWQRMDQSYSYDKHEDCH